MEHSLDAERESTNTCWISSIYISCKPWSKERFKLQNRQTEVESLQAFFLFCHLLSLRRICLFSSNFYIASQPVQVLVIELQYLEWFWFLFRGFFLEDYIFAWWNIWVSLILLFAFRYFLMEMARPHCDTPLVLSCIVTIMCWCPMYDHYVLVLVFASFLFSLAIWHIKLQQWQYGLSKYSYSCHMDWSLCIWLHRSVVLLQQWSLPLPLLFLKNWKQEVNEKGRGC